MPRFTDRKCVMIGEAMRSNYRAELGELPEERLGSGNRGNRCQVRPAQCVQRKCLASRRAPQISRHEMHDCDGNLWRCGGNLATHCFNGRFVGRLPGNHDEAGASRGLERLAPWAGGKKSCGSRPRICIYEQYVCVPTGSTVLEGVVEDYNLGSSVDGLSDTEPSI
jgi:hypothetical protein